MNQNKGRKNRNTTNKPRNKGPEKQIQPEGTYQNQRFMHAAASLVGCTAQILTQNNTLYEGIFYTFSEDFHIALKLAHRVDRIEPGSIDKDSVVENLIFKPQDVVDVIFKSVDMNYASKNNFTDSAISGYNGQVVERELQPWSAPSGQSDDMLLMDLSSSTTNGWDEESMLKTNQEKFGVESTYDESLSNYTMPLPVDKKDTEEYKQMEAMAQKKASEIESSLAYRTRVEVENGDEEEAFAAVARTEVNSDSSSNSGKYITPNRRKNLPPPRQQQQQRMNNRTYNQHPSSHLPPPSTRANHVQPPVMRADTGQQNTPSYAHPSASPQTTPSQTHPTTYVPITMNEDKKSPSEAPPKPQRTPSELPKPQRVPQVTSAPSQERASKSIPPSNNSNNRKSPSVEHHPAPEEKPHVPNKSDEDKTASLKRFSENFNLVERKDMEPPVSPSSGSSSAPATPEAASDSVKMTQSLNPLAKEFVPQRAPSVSNTPSRPMTPVTQVLQMPQIPQPQVNYNTEEHPAMNYPTRNYIFNIPMFNTPTFPATQPGGPPMGVQQGPTSRNIRKGNSSGGSRADIASINVAHATGPPLLTPQLGPVAQQPHNHPHNAPVPPQYLVQYPQPYQTAILPLTMVQSARGLQGIGPSSNHPEQAGVAGPQHLTFVAPQGQGPPNLSAPNQHPHTPGPNHGPQQPMGNHPMNYPPPVCSHTGAPNAQSPVVFLPQQFSQSGPHAVTSTVATMPMQQVYIQHPQANVLSSSTQMIPPS